MTAPPKPAARMSDSAGVALCVVLAGAGLCALKWAGWTYLADVPWWQLAAGPALALAFEIVVLATWFSAAGAPQRGGRRP